VSAPVVTLGEVMALFLAEPGPGLGTATAFELQCAGAEATVAVGLARLGHRATYLGRLGDDPLGAQVRATLRGHGVDVDGLRLVPDGPTGVLVRDAPADRPLTVQYLRSGSAASTLRADDLDADVVRGAALLHVTGITAVLSPSARAAVLHAVGLARAAGVPVSLDPNVRHRLAAPGLWREVLTELAPLADVVLTGTDDAAVVTDGDPARWFLDHGASTVVVKDGARGARETDGTTTVHQPVRPTVAVDPVGAGDAFAAGWIGGWLRGLEPAERMREAATVASLCVGARGDLAGLPDATTLRRVLAEGEGVDR
jgi:2-dehydro-3-deoxygluconokinase